MHARTNLTAMAEVYTILLVLVLVLKQCQASELPIVYYCVLYTCS